MKFAGTGAKSCGGKATFAFSFFSLAGKFMKLGKHALYNLIKNFSGR